MHLRASDGAHALLDPHSPLFPVTSPEAHLLSLPLTPFPLGAVGSESPALFQKQVPVVRATWALEPDPQRLLSAVCPLPAEVALGEGKDLSEPLHGPER